MDSDFGNLQPIAAAVVNARIEDLKMSEAVFEVVKLNGLDSVTNSACSSRKTSAISEPGIIDPGSQAETPSEPTVDSPSVESKTEPISSTTTPQTPAPAERTRKLSRFLVSPVVLPDNTVVVPEAKEVKPEAQPVQQPVQTQTIQSQIHSQASQLPATTAPAAPTQLTQPPAPVGQQIQTQTVQNVTTQPMPQYVAQPAVVGQTQVQQQSAQNSQTIPTQSVQYAQDAAYESVIQTMQYTPQVTEVTAETQSVMVPDPKWEKDEKHACK